MTLIDDWDLLWHKLWSIRLSLAAALLNAIAAGLSIFETTNLYIVVLAGVVNLAAAASRLVQQPKAYGDQSNS